MTIFELVAFESGRSITLRHRGRVWARIAVTYRVTADGPAASRLTVKLLARFSGRSLVRLPFRFLLPAGDLVMMRRQLLTLRDLAQG